MTRTQRKTHPVTKVLAILLALIPLLLVAGLIHEQTVDAARTPVPRPSPESVTQERERALAQERAEEARARRDLIFRLTDDQMRAIRDDSFEPTQPGRSAADTFRVSHEAVARIRGASAEYLNQLETEREEAREALRAQAQKMSDDQLCVTLGEGLRDRSILTVGVLREEITRRSGVEARAFEPRVRLGVLLKTVSSGMSKCEVLAALGEPQKISHASHRGPLWVYPIGSKVRFVHMDRDKVEHWSD